MTQGKLAELSNISVPTLKRMEASEDEVPGLSNNIAAVKTALERAGITFLVAGSGSTGAGVSLSHDHPASSIKPPLSSR
ncbi:MAG: transcriptional regulator [Hyphomicrobiales bacterium]